MIVYMLPLRTKPSGLYRHWRDLGLHKVGYRERNLHIRPPSLPSTQRRVPSGHGTKSSILCLHSPTVRHMYIVRLSEDPLIEDSLTRSNGIIFTMFCHSENDHFAPALIQPPSERERFPVILSASLSHFLPVISSTPGKPHPPFTSL